MIRILIILILLTGCNQVPKKLEGNKLMALDNFWDKLTQNATPAEKE